MSDKCAGCKTMEGFNHSGLASHIAFGIVLATNPQAKAELCERHGARMRATLEKAEELAKAATST